MRGARELAAAIALALLCAAPSAPADDPVEQRELAGWKVHVDRALLEGQGAELGSAALAALESHLVQIAILMEPEVLAELRQLELRLDLDDEDMGGMQYHPGKRWLEGNGHSLDLWRKVHIPQARELVSRRLAAVQPRVILHELAHAYHDQVLSFDHAEIRATWEAAVEAGIYDEVLHVNGRLTGHYALTDHKEYFAESTEAYFGANDFYPFVRAELELHDPRMHALLAEIWGELP